MNCGSEADVEPIQVLTADVFRPSQVAGSFYDVVQLRAVLVVTPLVPAGARAIYAGHRQVQGTMPPMNDIITKPKITDEIKVERPHLHKVILVNDDFTPRDFVVTVLKAEFHMSEDQALQVMMTAHRRGACVVAVFTKDVAEAKATNATDAGRRKGYPLLFTTEPEE